MANAAIDSLPPVPGPFAEFLKAPDYVSSVELRLSFEREIENELTLNAIDAKAAVELEKLINEGLEMGKQVMLSEITKEMRDSDDPVEQATKSYAKRLATFLADSIKPKRDNKKVSVSMRAQGDMATIGVLTALLLPAVQAAREAARRAQSQNNMRMIGIAMHNHHDAKRSFPAQANFDDDGKPLLSWRVHILPYLDQEALYNEFKLDEPWDSEHNRKLIERIPEVYRNPNRARDDKTNYLVPSGKGTIFDGKDSASFANITDGTANTIMLVEADADQAVVWTKPSDLTFGQDMGISGVGNLRPSGFQALLVDGSVRFLSNGIDGDMLKALFTAAGGERVGPFD